MNAIQERTRAPRRAVVLDGIPTAGETRIRDLLARALREAGFDLEVFSLRDLKIAACQGCFGCWIRTPGECVISDAGCDVAKAVIQSGLTVFLTPVAFGGYSSELKKAVDRLIPLIFPFFRRVRGEVHHRPRYRRYPLLLGVGLLDHSDPEGEEIFARHIARNAINLRSPAHAAEVLFTDPDVAETQARIRELVALVGSQR